MAPRREIRVNGRLLSNPEIAAEAQHHPAKTPAAAFQAAAQALVIRELLLEEVERQGIVGEPALLAPGKRELAEEASIRALIESAVPRRAPTEEECFASYAADPMRFGTKAGHALPFDEVRAPLTGWLAERIWREDAAQFVADLVARASIEGIAIEPLRRRAPGN